MASLQQEWYSPSVILLQNRDKIYGNATVRNNGNKVTFIQSSDPNLEFFKYVKGTVLISQCLHLTVTLEYLIPRIRINKNTAKTLNEKYEINFYTYVKDEALSSINAADKDDLNYYSDELNKYLKTVQSELVIFVGCNKCLIPPPIYPQHGDKIFKQAIEHGSHSLSVARYILKTKNRRCHRRHQCGRYSTIKKHINYTLLIKQRYVLHNT